MQDRVVLEQMGEGLVVGQIVDADNLYVGTGGGERPEVVATDPAESVDTNLHRHVMVPLRWFAALRSRQGWTFFTL